MHAEQSLPSAGSLAKGWDVRGIYHSTSCLKDINLGLDLISRERVKSAMKERTDLPLALHSLEDFQVPNEKLGKSFGLSRESFIPHFSTPSTSTFMAPPGARSVPGASPPWRHTFPMVRLPVFLYFLHTIKPRASFSP